MESSQSLLPKLKIYFIAIRTLPNNITNQTLNTHPTGVFNTNNHNNNRKMLQLLQQHFSNVK